MSPKTAAELGRLVSGSVVGDATAAVSDVTHDSRQAGTGILFTAVEGATKDGHEYVPDAVAAGSTVVCVNRRLDIPVTQIVVEDTRAVMGLLAARVHGDPSAEVPVVGVTGTNGKTTVTHYIESITASTGWKPGLIGTIRTSVGDTRYESTRTTPEATDFQRLLGRMRDEGADVIATEVSSHALDLERVAGTRFAVAAFTNLSQDHLDFHHDMASYRQAKERLFRDYDVESAVVNVDDPVGKDIASWAPMPVTTVGDGGDVRAANLVATDLGAGFDLVVGGEAAKVETPLIGSFNVRNALVAAACGLALGLTLDQVKEGLGSLAGVPGRFELVSGSSAIRVIVDYAHTPDSVRAAVGAAREVTKARVIAVLGAGGDRDIDKRPLMGASAALADLVIVTNDNPRSEDPGSIADAVFAGIPEARSALVELDRRAAIEMALDGAEPGDIVLVLGKGHETSQMIGNEVKPFSDRTVVRRLLGLTPESAGSGLTSGSMSL